VFRVTSEKAEEQMKLAKKTISYFFTQKPTEKAINTQ
jgi:hypothetical protein